MKTEEKASVPEPARGHDLFVSYSRADRERVLALTQGLAARGKRAWVDLEDIPPSAEWMAEIRSAIEAADWYLVVVSPALAGSKVCAEELEHAREAGKRIVPVLVRATDSSATSERFSGSGGGGPFETHPDPSQGARPSELPDRSWVMWAMGSHTRLRRRPVARQFG
jgi:hypothetical protein